MDSDTLRYWLPDKVYRFLRMLVLTVFGPVLTLISAVSLALGEDWSVAILIISAIFTFTGAIIQISSATARPDNETKGAKDE